MINTKLISKIIGSLLFNEAALMMLCLIMSLCYGESDTVPFLISFFVTAAAGLAMIYWSRDADNNMSRRSAYLVVSLVWIVFSIFGCIPLFIGGYVPTLTDAFFETMSGFTTTGASVIDDVESLPHGILLWRSLTQWLGGLGIVFFTIAVLPSIVGGSVRVFAAEATGPVKARMHPKLSTTAKWIWSIYILLTVACCLSFFLCGMGWFDSINLSMTTTATGGFSTHNDSVINFPSDTLEYLCILFQFLSGVNFTVLYMTFVKWKFKDFFRNEELRLYFSVVVVATLIIMYFLIHYNGYEIADALRCSLFQVVSFMTTTGLYTDDPGNWHHLTWVVLGVVMFLGACAGSTSGGFKCIRGLMILKAIRNEMKHILHPKAVIPVRVNGRILSQNAIHTTMAFFALFCISFMVVTCIMIFEGIDYTNSVMIAFSCVSNVGPSLGTDLGSSMSWAMLPIHLKWLLSLLMLMGRLEIFSVLVLFTGSYWKDN